MRKIIVVLSLITLLFSCKKQMTIEGYHNQIADFYSFYAKYFEVYTADTSTAEQLKQFNTEFLKREKADLSVIEQMKESGYDEELPQIFESWVNYIQMTNEQITREIIIYKDKDYNDLEELTKLERYHRDFKRYFKKQEELLEDEYFKFVNSYELEPKSELMLLRGR